MTDQTVAPDGSQDRTQATSYVVLVCTREGTIDEPSQWVEAGVMDVPPRTTRVTVAMQAKDMVRAAVGDMAEGSTVRFRVYPLDAQTEATATLARPAPQLQVTFP